MNKMNRLDYIVTYQILTHIISGPSILPHRNTISHVQILKQIVTRTSGKWVRLGAKVDARGVCRVLSLYSLRFRARPSLCVKIW